MVVRYTIGSSVLLTIYALKTMSANFAHGTLRPLNRTPQQTSSSPSSMTESGGSVIDVIRKRMQQMKDELAAAQDGLHAYQVEREREKHGREQVCLTFRLRTGNRRDLIFNSRPKQISVGFNVVFN